MLIMQVVTVSVSHETVPEGIEAPEGLEVPEGLGELQEQAGARRNGQLRRTF